ncbi:MAG: hypothetical protein AAF211_05810 [Myxococcota bacterium]
MAEGPPHLALAIDDSAIPGVSRCMTSAASGAPVATGSTLRPVFEQLRGPLRLLVTDQARLPEAMEWLGNYPDAKILVLAQTIDEGMLSAAARSKQILGFLAWRRVGVRPWELSYVVRRAIAPTQAAPSSADLLLWGASTVTWHPRTSMDRDQTVRAVEVVAMRFGISNRLAATAADAAHELLMNAMYDAPAHPNGTPRYAADRQADIALEPREVPTLRLTVDSSHLSLDATDPFGRLGRTHLFGGILRGRGGRGSRPDEVLDLSHGGAGLGLFNLFNSAAVLRAEVTPGAQTLVSWTLDRTVGQRDQRALPRSLYFVQGSPS